MIDDKVLDQILPVPAQADLKAELVTELQKDGFVITNFSSGGIFNALLMILIQCRIELLQLLRSVLNNCFISHASDDWLELKAADFAKTRKAATKTRGYVTVSRDSPGEAIRFYKGDVFKTIRDINGEELRFFVVEDSILQRDILSTNIEIEAEKEGARYNVPVGQITRSLTYIEGIDHITNGEGWVLREGSDIEEIESLRDRCLRSWAELSTRPIHDKVQNVAESVPGVLFARVDDMHPRGQGTTDIIITGTAGAATEQLLAAVRAAVDTIKGSYDDILVKSSETVMQDVAVTVTVPADQDAESLEERITASITEVLRIRRGRNLNELNHADLIYSIKKDSSIVKNVKVTTPAADIALSNDKVLMLGGVSVTIQRV